MFGYKEVCEEYGVSNSHFEILLASDAIPTADDIKVLAAKCQSFNAAVDQMFAKYEQSDGWKDEGFLSAQQTIVYKTGSLPGNIKKSLAKGNFLLKHPAIKEAIDEGVISYDHIVPLVPLVEEKYEQFFADDSLELIEMAKLMPAAQFSRAITQWKYIVNEVIEDDGDSRRYQERFLHIYESDYGFWRIDGRLDPVTGNIVKKAIEDVRSQLWRSHHDHISHDSDLNDDLGDDDEYEIDDEYTPDKQRADAIGYLAQGYVSASLAASTPEGTNPKHHRWFAHKVQDPKTIQKTSFHFTTSPALVADVVIDINDLKAQASTREFIEKCLTTAEPIMSAHSHTYRKQLLCDTLLDVPINHRDGTYDLGRSVRTAPFKLKRQLMLGQNHCTIDGCITPAQWCDAHHIKHWADGGKTSLDNLVLLCRRHHSMLHTNKIFAEKVRHKLKPGIKIRPQNHLKPLPLARTG